MKRLFSLVTVLCIASALPAQYNVVAPASPRSPTMLRQVLQDVVTKPPTYPSISGSPFLNDNWLLANVEFTDGRKADSVMVKLNAYENKLHFIDDKGEELQATLRVKQVSIIDANPSWTGRVYRSGFDGTADAIFQVLQDGTDMQLLRKVMLKIWESRVMGEEGKKSFEYEEEIYLAKGKAVYKPGKKCDLPDEAWGDKKDKVKQYISSNEIKCSRIEDLKKLLVYLNSL